MFKLCNRKTAAVCGMMAALLVLVGSIRHAEARPQYMAMWTETYPDVAKKNDVAKMVKCNVCHYGMSKKNRNAYGKAIEKALDGKKNLKKKDKEDFEAALKKAEDAKSGTEGKTFGDLLKAGELPAKGK